MLTGPVARLGGTLACGLGGSLVVAATALAWVSYRIALVLWFGCPRAGT